MAESTEPAARTEPQSRGTLVVADKVIERIAAMAAREVETVTDGSSGWRTVTRRKLPRASAKVAGDRTRIGVEVAATWPTPLPAMAAQVRDHVTERIATLTGFEVSAVDVTVADVLSPTERASRVD